MIGEFSWQKKNSQLMRNKAIEARALQIVRGKDDIETYLVLVNIKI